MFRTVSGLSALLLSAYLCGCTPHPDLVAELKSMGIEGSSITRIVLRGTEADVGPHVSVELSESVDITKLWSSIQASVPSDLWYAYGYRIVELHGRKKATLLVNESGATHIEGSSSYRYEDGVMKGAFYCPGLHGTVLRLLTEAAAQ